MSQVSCLHESSQIEWDSLIDFATYDVQPSSRCPAASEVADPVSSASPRTVQALDFVPFSEWMNDTDYATQPPQYIQYSIEWKVTVNNRAAIKDTESGVVLKPSVYWQSLLKPKLEALVSKKRPEASLIDTNIKVSINDRAERDLSRRFDQADVQWAQIEKQLLNWSELFRAGKRLTLSIAFNYKIVPPQGPKPDSKVGRSSATKTMLGERAAQIDAEEQSTNEPSIWRYVYKLMRCSGAPCHLGPHCWVDPDGKKHYRLKTHNLKALIKHVETGGTLDSHDDVPQTFREQLYAEAQYFAERTVKQPFIAKNSPLSTDLVQLGPPTPSRLIFQIPGFRDKLLKEYSEWQKTRYEDIKLRDEFEKAYMMALTEGMCLKQICREHDTRFFTDRQVMLGIAWSFVYDIEEWVKHKQAEARVS